MTAVLKHELRAYFHSLTAYVFGAFLLAFVGIGAMMYNLQAAVSNFEYVLSFGCLVFVVIVPILTMRVIAEEHTGSHREISGTAHGLSYPSVHHLYLPADFLAVRRRLSLDILWFCFCLFCSGRRADCSGRVYFFPYRKPGLCRGHRHCCNFAELLQRQPFRVRLFHGNRLCDCSGRYCSGFGGGNPIFDKKR